MISLASTRRRSGGEAGFTLIELIVVFVVMALVLALFISRGTNPGRGLNLQASATDLAGALREARSMAIASNRPVSVAIDVERRSWTPQGGGETAFPAGTRVTLTTTGNETRKGAGNIRFEPDGTSTGGRVELIDGGRRIGIGVDWLTGRVTVADAR